MLAEVIGLHILGGGVLVRWLVYSKMVSTRKPLPPLGLWDVQSVVETILDD